MNSITKEHQKQKEYQFISSPNFITDRVEPWPYNSSGRPKTRQEPSWTSYVPGVFNFISNTLFRKHFDWGYLQKLVGPRCGISCFSEPKPITKSVLRVARAVSKACRACSTCKCICSTSAGNDYDEGGDDVLGSRPWDSNMQNCIGVAVRKNLRNIIFCCSTGIEQQNSRLVLSHMFSDCV